MDADKNIKVVVPYTQIHPALEGALAQSRVDAEYVKLKGEYTYWELLCRLWDEGETFTIVEHDVLPWPFAIQEMDECEEWWCSMPYTIFGISAHSGIGCTKISKKLIQFRPTLPHEFADRSWRRLDQQLIQGAMPILPHRHGPAVLHMNAGSWGHFGEQVKSEEKWIEAEGRRHEVLLRTNPEYKTQFIKWVMGIESAAPISVRAKDKRDREGGNDA